MVFVQKSGIGQQMLNFEAGKIIKIHPKPQISNKATLI
jgi:hypothetical protein